MSFYVDRVTLRVGVSNADHVGGAEPDTFHDQRLDYDGSFEPERAHEAVARVFYEQLGVHDGYEVRTTLTTTEQGGSLQGVVITVVILAAVLASLPPDQAQRVGEEVLAVLIAAAIARAINDAGSD